MKECEIRRYIKSAPISKIDLMDLGKLIVDNNPVDKDFTISTTIGIHSIKEKSIEFLVAHKEIPDRLNNFHIICNKYTSNYKNEKYQYIVFGEPSFYLWVSGCDEVWVRGKFQQIEEFISSKLEQFNEEQKLAAKIEIPTSFEKHNETAITATLKKKDENSKAEAEITIKRKNIDRVFVVHGHDEEMKQSVARTLERLNLEPIILHEQPDGNKAILEKFKEYSDVSFAVIILSPDDFAYPRDEDQSKGKFRARQNVIMELGFLLAKLGREKIFILCRHDDNFEMPSDYSGILYTPYDNAGYWKYKMADEMKLVEPTIDKNKL